MTVVLIFFITASFCWLLIYLSDKGAINESKRSIQRRLSWQEERRKAWQELVQDRALEEDLAYYPGTYDEILEEVRSALMQMPSFCECKKIELYEPARDRYIPEQREDVANISRDMIADIRMAQRGKVCHWNTWGSGDIAVLISGQGRHTRMMWDRTFDFCVYIRDELRRHGVDARLIFLEGWESNYKRTAYDVDDVDKFHYKCGTLAWIQLTNFDENLKYKESV